MSAISSFCSLVNLKPLKGEGGLSSSTAGQLAEETTGLRCC